MQRWQETERKYTEVLRENKILKDKTKDVPGKMAELTKFNKEILKEKALLHYNLGVLYTQSGDYQKAVKEFNEVLKINANDPDAHYNLGVIHSEYIIDEEKAETHFRRYLDITPDDEDADKARKYILVRETIKTRK